MYFDPKLFALQAAMLHLLLKNNPELRGELLDMVALYENSYFTPNADVGRAMQDAFYHMLAVTEPTVDIYETTGGLQS